ncbi:alpha-ketoglutarate-dependent dioxygenase AlkB family protein [Brackiella oedipodis]|uniref:alpha-ketoglutarate-dependent dioxygenase AlkB family protein n=1 Tax=Brackiella oedipodis TaxID=124225 RepID=UPI000687528C|nr:alpha-ketoglutarate-dependent dioxygenase AlkB [Brackiella oedipodis]
MNSNHTAPASLINRLPYEGEVYDYGVIYTPSEADDLFANLLTELNWQAEHIRLFGKTHITKRLSSWHGDKAYSYKYAGFLRQAQPWTPTLQRIKQHIQRLCACDFNSCLANLYHNGSEAMGWHSDNESSLQKNAAIASLSLGAERRFVFKHKSTQEKLSFSLPHGSLLVMAGTVQEHWWHSLPASKKIHQARINLTFRTMLEHAC